MVDFEIVHYKTSPAPLLKTFSTENYKLMQVETGLIVGSTAIDAIEGYIDGIRENGNGIPYGRYTYIETDEKDTDAQKED